MADPDGTSILKSIALVATIAYVIVKSGILGYSSPDATAKAFSRNTYSKSRYIRHEYGTQIYSRKIFGTTRYYYAKPVSGSPHSVQPLKASIPNGGKMIAFAHTHPNSNDFSSADKSFASKLGGNIYVVGPNLNVQCYDYLMDETYVVGTICLVSLSNEQKEHLRAEFQSSWDSRIVYGQCEKGFDCGNMTWPTE